ncbi:MAG: FAD-dependent oxidoreductase [Microbacterium sp.]
MNSPLTLRGQTFRNRIFMANHGQGLAQESDRLEFYRLRAQAGVAMFVTEAYAVVLPTQRPPARTGADDSCIPKVRAIVETCRAHGAGVVAQILHQTHGTAYGPDGVYEMRYAPSDQPDELYRVMPREIRHDEILELVEQFGHTADRMRRAGVNGVEINVAGYLHWLFLGEKFNHREDEFGGSFEGRMRFLDLTLREMRRRVGEDLILGVRLSGNEGEPGGALSSEILDICHYLDEHGLVDYISLRAGSKDTMEGAPWIVPSMHTPSAYAGGPAKELKKRINTAVFVTGRINTPELAEELVAQGGIAMIGMVRALLADPLFVEKAAAGRGEDIRACIGCNQACIGHFDRNRSISCIQHPQSGRETRYPTRIPLADERRRVVVVGGGPAGMKAASVAAQRGHDVTLFDAGKQLGGQAQLAQSLPGRAEFGGLITNLQSELLRFGADIRRQEATGEDIRALSPDAVILATGSLPYAPPLEGDFQDMSVHANDVVSGQAKVGGSVVIADWRCDWVGIGVAEMLQAQGRRVRLCVNGETAGELLDRITRYHAIGRLHRAGVEILPYLSIFGADSGTVYFQHIITRDAVVLEDVDTLVLASGMRRHDPLAQELRDFGPALHLVGDCLTPRTAEEAIYDGFRAAMAV